MSLGTEILGKYLEKLTLCEDVCPLQPLMLFLVAEQETPMPGPRESSMAVSQLRDPLSPSP